MSGIKTEIKAEVRQFIEKLPPRQQEYVLSRLAEGKDAYITLRQSGVCPRCEQEYRKIQLKFNKCNVYFYIYHGDRRCYVGPENYIYVSFMNSFIAPLHGAIKAERVLRYIERIRINIKAIEDIDTLERILEELTDLIGVIEYHINDLKHS